MGGAPRVAVLVSGTGTILGSLLAARIPVGLVLADRTCPALAVARRAGVNAVVVDRTTYGWPAATWDRPAFTAAVVAALQRADIRLVAMAGFMTVLAPEIFTAFPGRVLNTHPSLLPAFRGGRAVADALAAGVTVTGCTVHVATARLDAGPVLAQARVGIRAGDTVAVLHERIKAVERRLYPEVIAGQLQGL